MSEHSDYAQPIPLLSDFYTKISLCNQLRVLKGIWATKSIRKTHLYFQNNGNKHIYKYCQIIQIMHNLYHLYQIFTPKSPCVFQLRVLKGIWATKSMKKTHLYFQNNGNKHIYKYCQIIYTMPNKYCRVLLGFEPMAE